MSEPIVWEEEDFLSYPPEWLMHAWAEADMQDAAEQYERDQIASANSTMPDDEPGEL